MPYLFVVLVVLNTIYLTYTLLTQNHADVAYQHQTQAEQAQVLEQPSID